MAPLWTRKRAVPESQPSVYNQLALTEIVQKYDIVDVVSRGPDVEPYILVSEPGPNTQYSEGGVRFAAPVVAPGSVVDFRELGTSSPSPFTSFMRQEYNAELRDERGLQKYNQMRLSDGTVAAVTREFKTAVLGARWFIQPASDSAQDIRKAEFVWDCLTKYQSISWTQVLYEALLMFEFGYYMFEKVWDVRIVRGQPRIVWAKLAPRHPMDVKSWQKDRAGGPVSVTMFSDLQGPDNLSFQNDVTIPIEKLLVFTYQREAGNIQGISGLRPVYKHWFYKEQLYKIDAIQKERHGIGIPVIKLPMGFTAEDKVAADQLGRNLRTNERAHVVLPPNWELIFAKLEGQPVDAMRSIEHHDARIRETIVAKFLSDDVTTDENDVRLHLKVARFLANIVADTFNLYAIPQLIDYNFSRNPNGYPTLVARGLGEEEEQRTMSFTLRNLVGAGLITPDEKLEAHLRKNLDLPMADIETRRQIAQPQNPNNDGEEENSTKQRGQRAGLPRQTPAKPPTTPRSNSGTDRSGGK